VPSLHPIGGGYRLKKSVADLGEAHAGLGAAVFGTRPRLVPQTIAERVGQTLVRDGFGGKEQWLSELRGGRGLFAVRTVEEPTAAIAAIESDYMVHATAARKIAAEFLDASKVLAKLLREIGI
jgi:hypothetical protein